MKTQFLFPFTFVLFFTFSCTSEVDIIDQNNLPTLRTLEVSDIGSDSVVGGLSDVDGKGLSIIEYGLCWSTNEKPTNDQDKLVVNSSIIENQIQIEGLDSETKYYLRAYATTEKGTGYGNQIEFTTSVDVKPPCQTQENTLFFDDVQRNFSGVLYLVQGGGLFYGDYGLWGSGTQGDLTIEFSSPPETGIYKITHDGFFQSTGECAVTGVFKPMSEPLSQRYTARAADDAFVYVLKTGEGQYSMTFCNVKFSSGATTYTFEGSYGNLSNVE